MKKTLFALFLITCATRLLGQNMSLQNIPKDYSLSFKTPLPFFKNDTIAVNCDTVYVINAKRYKMYRDIQSKAFKADPYCASIVDSFEVILTDHKNSYDSLFSNCKQTEKIALEVISGTRDSLTQTQSLLSSAEQKLGTALQDLENAKKAIQDAKRKSFKQKLLIGACGVAGGVLIGLLISN